jgi:hypothetical protein
MGAMTETEEIVSLIDEALARAWDQGYTSGHSRAMRCTSDEPNVEPGKNPYRA